MCLVVVAESCPRGWLADLITAGCVAKYSGDTEETGDFLSNWNSSGSPEKQSPWTYHTQESLDTLPIWGNLASYTGGGYILQHTAEYNSALNQQRALFSNNWLDRQTRAVVTEFALYSADTNLFSYVTLLLELPVTGGALTWWDINVMTLYSYTGNYAVFRICAEFMFILVLAVELVSMGRSIIKKKKAYFSGLWSYIDLLLLCGSVITTALYIARYFYVREVMRSFYENKG